MAGDQDISLGYRITGAAVGENLSRAQKHLMGAMWLYEAEQTEKVLRLLGWDEWKLNNGIRRALDRRTAHIVSLRIRSPWRYAIGRRIERARHWIADRFVNIATHIGGPYYDRY